MIRENLAVLKKKINDVAKKSGRLPGDINLIAVSKNFGIDKIMEAYKAGIRNFGENRVQEAMGKIGQLDADIRWHFIGRLQSNKAKIAAKLFNVIHSVDSKKLAQKINMYSSELGIILDILLQVNMAGEATKSGVAVKDAVDIAKEIDQLKNVKLTGLMTIPPYFEDSEGSRQYYKGLRELKDTINEKLGKKVLTELSMGMSNDYDIAIQEGATFIRVGTSIFGERN